MTGMDPVTWRRIARTGFIGSDAAAACHGYVLFSPQNRSRLTLIVDAQGREVHRWTHEHGAGQWGYLLPNGNLFFNAKMVDECFELFPDFKEFKGGALLELDPAGKIVWSHRDPTHHHDGLRLAHGGALYLALRAVSRDLALEIKGGVSGSGDEMYADEIIEVDSNGNKVWSWDASQHLDPRVHAIGSIYSRREWTHMNSLALVDENTIVASARNVSTLFFICRKTGRILKELRGPAFSGQHDPRILASGNILLFDNGVERSTGGHTPYSRVIEVLPDTGHVVWEYKDDPLYYFFSSNISGVDPLPNGNVLVTDGQKGRIFQVNRQGQVIWEYINPHFDAGYVRGTNNSVHKARFYLSIPFV